MSHIVRFDCFEVDLDAGQLLKHGTRIKLRDQSFQILASLLAQPGRVVSREDLRRSLWHDGVFVDFDNNLNIVIARLREALGDSGEHPRFIETLPKHGYRFVAPVTARAIEVERVPQRRAKLVVLPFLNLSGDVAQEYFSDAMTDEIITEMAAVSPERLAVIARTTAMLYKASRKDITCISKELGVDYVVEGAVRRQEDQIAINVQLIQASDQTHVFAKRFDAVAADIFNVQSSIAQAILEHIPAVAGDPKVRRERRAPKHTDDLVAYNEYIQARYQFSRVTPEAVAMAKQHLEKAIARDPRFAGAHDALAELYWYLGYFGLLRPRDAFSVGIVHALRAVEIDNERAETHALLGEFHKTIGYNWPEVHREMSIARRLNPVSPVVRMRYAVSELMPHGRLREAREELERALELDPLSFFARFWLGIVLVLERNPERAIEEGKKLLDIGPGYSMANFVLGVSYRYQNKIDESLTALRKAKEGTGGAASVLGWLGMLLAAKGDVGEARSVLQRLREMELSTYVPPCSFAWVHLGLGEVDTAFEWLNRAVGECDQLMMPIKSYAFFDPIRHDPRFALLLRKMNLVS